LAKKQDNSLTESQRQALVELSKDDSIIVTKADKGNAVVILNKEDYRNQLLKILSDKSKFSCIEKDMTIEREEKLKNKLSYLLEKKIISTTEYNKIRPIGSRPGTIYGLPKIHKTGNPLRPIISAVGTYNYELAKYLDRLIKPLLGESSYMLKDTFDFVNRVSKLNCEGMEMGSFDVESLFPNIPLDETIDIVLAKAFKNKNDKFHGYSKTYFRKLLKIALQESHFQFLELTFDQIDGVAMGSPLAPTMAAFFMDNFEKKYVSKLEKLGVRAWFRYVDDVFVLKNKESDISLILNFLNNKHTNIKFTYESEKKKKMPFLDVSLKRVDGKIHTTIYRKPTFTGVYLNWFSLTSTTYKVGLINCLLDRAWKICSDYELFHVEILNIKAVLKKNNYPCRVVDEVVRKFLNKKFGPMSKTIKTLEIENKNKNNKVFLVLPFYNKFCEDFKSKLTKTVNHFYPDVDFRVLFKCPATISSLFPFKERVPFLLKSLVVYKLSCATCKKSYVGMTTRCLIRRINEHKGVKKSKEESSVLKHQRDTGHIIDYAGIEVIDKADSKQKLLLKEMLHIIKLKPEINVQRRSSLFSLIIGKT
jgi:hypothetical protein